MTKKERLEALVVDLKAVAQKHNMVLDKYVGENGKTEYFFRLQPEDAEANIEEVFLCIYHGPPGSK